MGTKNPKCNKSAYFHAYKWNLNLWENVYIHLLRFTCHNLFFIINSIPDSNMSQSPFLLVSSSISEDLFIIW